MHVSKRMALHGLNISMAVFTGISAYGLLGFLGIGAETAGAATLRETLLFAAGIATSIAGICFFGIQLDRRKAEDRKTEEQRNAAESAKKISKKPARPV
ncbi:MAG TPA: hypothetical protein VF853_07775 [Candidatus Deferrimicrobiaceae bacterium]